MNLIVTDGTTDLLFTLFRLYKNHWIELQAFKIADGFDTQYYSTMPEYLSIIISGRFFMFGDTVRGIE